MGLRAPFKPLRPDLDDFLFAEVGEEREGNPLSVASALTRLGLDPWDEAGRLASLNKRDAVESLARLIAELPGTCPPSEAGHIAGGLIERLPQHDRARPSPPQRRARRWPAMPKLSRFWVLCAVAAAAAMISLILHGGFPFG